MLILVGCTYQAVRQPSEDIMSKTEFYADLNRDFQALMAGETSFLAMIANTSALLFERLTEVNWAGFYLLEGDTLVLGPFQGKLACVRIPVGRGVCGRRRVPRGHGGRERRLRRRRADRPGRHQLLELRRQHHQG